MSLCVQLSWELGEKDKRWFCERAFQKQLADGKVELLFYDTVPFVQKYYKKKWASSIGRCYPDAALVKLSGPALPCPA